MIIVLKSNANPAEVEKLKKRLTDKGVSLHCSEGQVSSIIGVVGDTSAIDVERIEAVDIVESVKRIQEPYKKANRKFHPENTIVDMGFGAKVGGGHFAMMAGPCSVESPEQILAVAKAVKNSGATVLRGGAFKPRTSPYAFQGMEADGLKLMLEAQKEVQLPIVSELMDLGQLPLFDDVNVIQIGARNMQNFTLLKEIGKINKPILLKRGLANTIDEWLMSAEYIMAGGNENVILCERGIRTYETAVRNTLDLSAIPVIREKSHLPIIVDPSHATGHARYVEPLALAAVAAGADGLMIEVHNDPANALCDGPQSLTPEQFDKTYKKVCKVRDVMKEI